MRDWDEVLSESLNGTRVVNDAAIDRAESALAEFDLARIVERIYIRNGIRNDLKRITKNENRVLVNYNGTGHSKAAMLGTRRRQDDGTIVYQTEAIHVMSWAQLEEWRQQRSSQVDTERINVHMANTLLSLRDQFPDSLGPADACELLGVTVEEFLAASA
jgi:hypothetical protein